MSSESAPRSSTNDASSTDVVFLDVELFDDDGLHLLKNLFALHATHLPPGSSVGLSRRANQSPGSALYVNVMPPSIASVCPVM